MDEVSATSTALCPGGNLEDADGLMLIVLSTGGPTSFDTMPAAGANDVAHGACSVGPSFSACTSAPTRWSAKRPT